MWKYEQLTGRIFADFYSESSSAKLIGVGYSGKGEGKNKPDLQDQHSVGPIPVGLYRIHEPVDTVTHGPYVLRLEPDASNEMFGRDGFLIHGDSVIHPGTASEGCIILPRGIREEIWKSRDHDLRVVSGLLPVNVT
jgi:hypothetical protein